MKTFRSTTEERKDLVRRISELTGNGLIYTRAPLYAYEGSGFTVTREGGLKADDTADKSVIETLFAEGLIIADDGAAVPAVTPEGETESPCGATEAPQCEDNEGSGLMAALPLDGHTGATLRNLVNLFYTRGKLINKALGTDFRIEKELTEVLRDEENVLTVDNFLKAIADFEAAHGKAIDGLSISEERITFGPFADDMGMDEFKTFAVLAELMEKQAMEQKRILAKDIEDENEKYVLRIWLTRIGMNGPGFKKERKVLMRNLSGHSAFHTKEEEERWKKRQAEKREAAKAGRQEVASDEVPA